MKKPTKKPLVECPKLLILHEKHGEAYYYIPDEETLFKLALKILKSRKGRGYYYEPLKDPPKAPAISRTDVEGLPDAQLRRVGSRQWQDYDMALRNHEEYSQSYKSICDALREENGAKAWGALRARCDYEYENCELRHFDT